ncbi:MAG: hypothetical protein IPK92_19825 [Nitrospira sp.]|jgi:probable HAF family extracellular repeat protein|nr:hypothetical protein [Nitrospira sp.]
MITTRQTLQHSALVAIGLLALAGSPALALDYVFSDLGTITGPLAGTNALAMSINSHGQVAGISDTHAYRWNGETATALGTLPGGVASRVYGINDAGFSVGYIELDPSLDATTPVRYDGTTPTPLQVIGGGTQMYGTIAWQINNQNQAVGEGWSNELNYIRPLLWQEDTTVIELPTLGGLYGTAAAINDVGQVHGASNTANDEAVHATLWENGVAIDLGTLGGSYSSINDNNNLGQAVGASRLADDETWRATLWNGTTITELPSLGGTGGSAFAASINNLGVIVGQTEDGHAVLWKDGQVIDLNSYIPADLAAAGWVLNMGGGINDDGVIVGNAYRTLDPETVEFASFKLTPVPVPAAVWLFGSGLAGLVGVLRRRQSKA